MTWISGVRYCTSRIIARSQNYPTNFRSTTGLNTTRRKPVLRSNSPLPSALERLVTGLWWFIHVTLNTHRTSAKNVHLWYTIPWRGVQCTVQCTVIVFKQCTIQCTIQCTMKCTILCTVKIAICHATYCSLSLIQILELCLFQKRFFCNGKICRWKFWTFWVDINDQK